MPRIVVLYDAVPDAPRLAEHVALCRLVPGGAFAHGPTRRTLFGRETAYVAEWSFASDEELAAASASEELRTAAGDAAAMGIAHSVHVVDITG